MSLAPQKARKKHLKSGLNDVGPFYNPRWVGSQIAALLELRHQPDLCELFARKTQRFLRWRIIAGFHEVGPQPVQSDWASRPF